MPFKFTPKVEDLSTVPAPFHGLYDKTDEGYVMKQEAFEAVDTSGLHSALEKERKSASTNEKEAKAWKALGFESPDKVQETLAALKEEVAKKGQDSNAFEKFKNETSQAHAAALKEKEEKVAAMQKSMYSYMVESEATRLLAEAKGSPALLMPHISSRAKVVEENGKFAVRVVDQDGDVRHSTSTGAPMTLSDLITELKGHAEFGKAFEATGNKGSGMLPGAGNRQPNRVDPAQMSPTQKIAAGLTAAGK